MKAPVLAKKTAKIAFVLFVVFTILFIIWEPVTGYLVQNDVGPSRQIWGCDPAEEPCCFEPYNISNASYPLVQEYDASNTSEGKRYPLPLHIECVRSVPCFGGLAMVMLVIAVIAMAAWKLLAPKK